MRLRLEGITPLMMHNVRLADPDEPIVQQIKAITDKKTNMTETDRHEVNRLKFLGSLYYDDRTGPYLPAANMFASIIEGARKTRGGKDAEAGIIWLADKAELEYEGPRDPDKMWNDGNSPFVDRRMVTVNRARVPGVRAIFPDWACEIAIDYDEKLLDLNTLKTYAHRGGRIGVGDYRRFYGRYRATITEE